MNKVSRQQGSTMIELLVAIFVMVTALVGFVGLQMKSVQSNQSSYYRSQASFHANNMAELIQANRNAALQDAYNVSYPTTPPAAGSSRASKDLNEWFTQLAASLPDGNAELKRTNDNIVIINIRWNDTRGSIHDTSNPINSNALTTFEYRTAL